MDYELLDKQLPQKSLQWDDGGKLSMPFKSRVVLPVASMDLSQELSVLRGQALEGKVTGLPRDYPWPLISLEHMASPGMAGK